MSVRNAGNRPESFEATASDKAKFLKYEFEPPSVALGAGQDQPLKLRVRPTKAILIGQQATRVFTVDVQGDGPDTPPVALSGTLSQRSIIPSSTPKYLGALLAFAMAALALWGLFFKPQIDQAIKDAVAPVASDLAAVKSNLPPPSGAAEPTPTPEPTAIESDAPIRGAHGPDRHARPRSVVLAPGLRQRGLRDAERQRHADVQRADRLHVLADRHLPEQHRRRRWRRRR